MPLTTPWYVGQRAESYAVVLFTRIPNILVQHTVRAPDRGIDLLIAVGDDPTARTFGVEVKGTEKIDHIVRGDGTLRATVAEQLRRRLSDYTFPVGVLVVDVVRDDARFGWVLEPKGRSLKKPAMIKTVRVTTEYLHDCVEVVRAWYMSRAHG